jgi:ubiquinone/menaquinone biosynthesis C-methylase UbiE
MAIGNKKTTNHLEGFKAEINKVSKSNATDFFNWFDESGGNVETNFVKGQCEFTLYILTPTLGLTQNLKDKTILEIGYGGGRLLAEASRSFKHAIGVDIHENDSFVKEEFKKRNITNFALLKNDGKTLPVKDSSINLIYSFIVLQHIEKISTFDSYMQETYRALEEGGIAILFFAKLYRLSLNNTSKTLYTLDKLLEKIHHKGYREIITNVNCVNLKVSLPYAEKRARKVGFTIIKKGVSKKLPDLTKYGGQHYLILKK